MNQTRRRPLLMCLCPLYAVRLPNYPACRRDITRPSFRSLHSRLRRSSVSCRHRYPRGGSEPECLVHDTLDAVLTNSLSVGGKIGAWFPSLRSTTGLDYGVEVDVTKYRPHIKSGAFNATGSFRGMPVGVVDKTGVTDVNATIVAVYVLLRMPLSVSEEFPNGRLFPYAGAGLAFSVPSTGLKDRDTNDVAFQGIAGLQMLIWQRVGIIGGYKLTHARQSFTIGSQQQTLDFTVSHAVVGLAVHLGP